jgi:hypothetical protein
MIASFENGFEKLVFLILPEVANKNAFLYIKEQKYFFEVSFI